MRPENHGGPAGSRLRRNALGLILTVVALNAFGGGYYGLAGAEGVPLEWLEGSPFTSYTIPSLILAAVVGGSSALAAYVVFRGRPRGRTFSALAGSLLLLWIAVQVSIIGYVSPLQPIMGATAVVILLLAYGYGSA